MSITNPLASFFGQTVSDTQQQPAQTNQANYMNQLGAGGAGAYYQYSGAAAQQQQAFNQAMAQQAMQNQYNQWQQSVNYGQKKLKLIEEERDLLLNNEGLRELAAIRDEANAKYQAFLALLRKV